MKTSSLLLAAAAALAGCNPDFDPASQVDGMRVLAVRAEPPEIGPTAADGPAALTSLVLRPEWTSDPGRQTTILYLACTPVPGDPTPSPCVALASLRDPTAVLAEAARASCAAASAGDAHAPASFVGAEVCDRRGCGPVVLPGGAALPAPLLELPQGYGFDALPPGAPGRILGVEAAVLAFAIDATAEELAGTADGACPLGAAAGRLAELWSARQHVLSVKRVQIRGPEAPDPRNRNPVVAGIAAGGTALEAGAPTAVADGTIALAPILPDGAAGLVDAYTELDTSGAPLRSELEEWAYSWFSTAGELDEDHTRGADADEWKLRAGETALVAAVVRDLRGGVAWQVREVTAGAGR
jgi:hypothetical protein